MLVAPQTVTIFYAKVPAHTVHSYQDSPPGSRAAMQPTARQATREGARKQGVQARRQTWVSAIVDGIKIARF